ncbi:unnamed protein product [Effrenium voratum]|nr:unnamed protein product [Effrenium voratum]
MIPFLLKFRDIVERISHHVMLERLAATSEVVVGLALKRGEEAAIPDWDLVVKKVDVRGALNVYLSLLTSERFVVNVGMVDTKKQQLCQKSLGFAHGSFLLCLSLRLIWLRVNL